MGWKIARDVCAMAGKSDRRCYPSLVEIWLCDCRLGEQVRQASWGAELNMASHRFLVWYPQDTEPWLMAQLPADLPWYWKSGVSRVSANNFIVSNKHMFS